ncbi:NADH-quinone oxidoreductase subunit J [Halorhodospira halochloris]|uniref:NADH-quinone oxidoreductase subunit J n=1 Tax=Halorhodospira halochloris TaxID=1052 RepID=A0A0X8X925_HALHR|nr:NADH-quinone oxidoreductase subunit J [Halorhodospira halochloris]MBK1652367.1 NADH:ubiquinone oxidoreductase subunit J [Halorhodospira halochloris]MCG5530060.1 NADH-quinone oxidoreductase subunit J [Halorhodospira halochloris]MCG5548480.1 NADH-quinone oxidoreductase subunit J [Halorhodospira halochloris]BAU57771.1 NADH-ubiquinone oxidoreductase chain J [Halorhodospira halochloris]
MEQIIFYIFAGVLLFAATMVISVRNPVHAALFLVLAFFNAAIIWVLSGAEFLGLALIVVYVGAVMVLFMFVLMMLDINTAVMREGFARYLPVGLLVAVLMFVQLVVVILSEQVDLVGGFIPEPSADVNNIRAIGEVLYTVYVYPFEIAAVILLVAIVAAISLTMRRRPDTARQDVPKQLSARKEQRLRLVQMGRKDRRRSSE